MPTEDKEQPAVEEEAGLDVDLGKVFDEVNKAEEPEKAPAKPVKEDKPETKAEEPEVKETPPEPKAEDPKSDLTPEVKEEPAEEPAETVAPPATWTADAKEKFGNLDPAIQHEVLKREKDFAHGIQKNAESAKQADLYEQVIAPYKAMIASEGATPQQAVASLMNTAYQLRTASPDQKTKLILDLAKQYGADLSQVSPNETDEYIDPDIKNLKDQINSLQSNIQSQQQVSQNQQLQGYQQQITTFSQDPKNVHFDKVRDSMSALLTSGNAGTLQEAYDKSLYMVPEVRETLIQEQVKAAETVRKKSESEAADKAKKAAGTQLTDEATGIVQPTDGTMEEDLAAAFDAAEAKAS